MGWNLFNSAFVVLAAGCGRIAFAPAGDATATDSGEAASCRTATYGAPVLVPGVSDPAVNDATLRLSNDELRGFLWAARSGNIDLEFATRTTLTAPFTTTPVTELNTPSPEFEPTISADERVLVFRSSRAGGTGGADLWLAERVANTGPFPMITELVGLNTAGGEIQPFLAASALYFVSDRAGDPDLYVAPRVGPTTFSAPSRVDELSNVGSQESDPTISFDGLSIYFGSDRLVSGDVDLYVATRPTIGDPFGVPVRLPQLSSLATDGVSWESLDGCRLYMANSTLGTADVYMATRNPQ